MAERSLLGVQGIHPWNGPVYFCGQGKYDGKAILPSRKHGIIFHKRMRFFFKKISKFSFFSFPKEL